jgi:hypothetical protein
MRFLSPLFAVGAFALLSACGGGGGGSGGSSSSSPTVDSGSYIFQNSFNAEWGSFSAFEWNTINNAGKNYTDGQSGNFVSWSIQDSVADHQSVVDVKLGNAANVWGQFEVSLKKDLSSYGTGKIAFDINPIDFGSAWDTLTQSATFEVRAECVWPCTSHPYFIVFKKANEWSHVELDIKEMVTDGLDLANIDRALIIKPVSTQAQNVHLQLDNIRWVKGTGSLPSSNPIVAEHFNLYSDAAQWAISADPITMQPGASVGINMGLSMYPALINNSYYSSWQVEKTLANSINIHNKKVSLQLLINKGVAPTASFSFFAVDTNGRRASMGDISASALTLNVYNRVSFNINSNDFSADFGFDDTKVSRIGIAINTHNMPVSEVWPNVVMDEVVIQ